MLDLMTTLAQQLEVALVVVLSIVVFMMYAAHMGRGILQVLPASLAVPDALEVGRSKYLAELPFPTIPLWVAFSGCVMGTTTRARVGTRTHSPCPYGGLLR